MSEESVTAVDALRTQVDDLERALLAMKVKYYAETAAFSQEVAGLRQEVANLLREKMPIPAKKQ